MTLLSIAGLCTFALVVWLLWLEHREELCALADPRNVVERIATEDDRKLSTYSPPANEPPRRPSVLVESRVEVGNGY